MLDFSMSLALLIGGGSIGVTLLVYLVHWLRHRGDDHQSDAEPRLL